MRLLIFFILIFLLISCRSENNNIEQIISEESVTNFFYRISPAGENSSLPRLYCNGEDLFMSWIEKKDTVSILKYAVFSNDQWNDPVEIISGSDWFVNWADFPSIAENKGSILTSYLQKSATGTYTYDIKLNLFSKRTNSWKKNFILHDDGTKSEHGFVSILPWNDDRFFVAWLDGRNTIENHNSLKMGNKGMTIRGAFVNSDGLIIDDTELDPLTCDCCQTDAAITNEGIILAYRDRSINEIRDISIVRFHSKNGWSDPQIVGDDNWKIAGCPVNGPSIDAYGNNIVIAWFTAVNENPSVKVAFSDDGGKSFGSPWRVDKGNAIGRVDVEIIDGDNALIVWMEPKNDDTLIQLMQVSSDGTVGLPITIAKTHADRASGFPQLEIVGKEAYVVWTSLENQTTNIKMASVRLKDL
jgi:hypothetical protein